jgi:hypothetical protein
MPTVDEICTQIRQANTELPQATGRILETTEQLNDTINPLGYKQTSEIPDTDVLIDKLQALLLSDN